MIKPSLNIIFSDLNFKEVFYMSQKYSRSCFTSITWNGFNLYKDNAVRHKYYLVQRKLKELAPDLHMNELNRRNYQGILNKYAQDHEKTTTLDFHHHLKASLFDAVDDGLLKTDPTRRAIIKGCDPSDKKLKFLNLYELQTLLRSLNLGQDLNWDWFFLLIAKNRSQICRSLSIDSRRFLTLKKQKFKISNKSWKLQKKKN